MQQRSEKNDNKCPIEGAANHFQFSPARCECVPLHFYEWKLILFPPSYNYFFVFFFIKQLVGRTL